MRSWRADSLCLRMARSRNYPMLQILCDAPGHARLANPERRGKARPTKRTIDVSTRISDALTQLAFALFENKGVIAILLGSGLSRAAEIQTGWEITVDLIRRVAQAQGIGEQSDWAEWYRQRTGQEPNYSTLLEELTGSPNERRAILNRYIEASEEDREEGRKIATAAHHAIAELVRQGYIRVIITTNFDRLIENALREIGIEPTVVASVDALSGAEPIAHSACYILKLHGDYKDTRILNTDAELSSYPPEFDRQLDRIFDEYGLIVCGWSGEWDHALRAAFLRAPNRRYPVYWVARGKLRDGAQGLVNHRRARVISATDADSFFTSLLTRVQAVEQTQRQNPLSIELLVRSAKRYLSKSEYRIQLDELFTEEADRVLKELDGPEFDPTKSFNQDDFHHRVQKYESITEPLARMVGVLGRWGENDSELPLVLSVINSLYRHSEKIGGGTIPYVNIRSYPAVLVFTAYGLGLTYSERWAALHSLFAAEISRQHKAPRRVVEELFLETWSGWEQKNCWDQIDGVTDPRRTPLSDHLLKIFTEWGTSFLGLSPDFELMFERFELLGSLAHLERNTPTEIHAELEAGQVTWVPYGRLAWHSQNRERLLAEMRRDSMKAALTKAGFAQRNPAFVTLFISNFERMIVKLTW
jgi:phosphoglycolate phosphatase-like HAD superfamily hydrolase